MFTPDISDTHEDGWFLSTGGADRPRTRVFCFPHAGGNPRSFLDWQAHIGADAEIVAVCMPGRAHRVGERAPVSVEDYADSVAAAIARYADEPIVLFGHSLGALVAFEVTRRLRDVPAVDHLIASGCAAPSLVPSPRVVRAAGLRGRAFAEEIGFLGGLAPEVVADEELCELLLPGLHADCRLVAAYRYEAAAPLDVGVTLVNGRDDPHVGRAAVQPWLGECRRPPDQHWVDGGHFYFDGRPSAVIDVLRPLLRDACGRVPAIAEAHVELI